MTDHYMLATSADLQQRFGVTISHAFTEATQDTLMPIIAGENPRISLMRWGIRPDWAVEKGSPFCRLFEAKSEILEEIEKNAHRQIRVQFKRCIIPATSFFLGSGEEARFEGEKVMGLAGVYERWVTKHGEDKSSFALITSRVEKERVPIPLDPGVEARWLDPNFNQWNVLSSFLVGRKPVSIL
jgi:putative SOS response-associated peptidase YedK